MIVITLTDCPPSLRGDLSKWLIEIQTGVYVGKVSARVRDALWARIKENAKKGKATLVYPAKNEQRMSFRVHNTTKELIDFDGIKLVLHPSIKRLSDKNDNNTGFSKAHQFQKAKRHSQSKMKTFDLNEYIVFDIETTGLYPNKDDIIEISAIKVKNNKEVEIFNKLILTEKSIPKEIEKLTGITNALLKENGIPLEKAMSEFQEFIVNQVLISHNLAFDLRFINEAMEEVGFSPIKNQGLDTLSLARKITRGLKSYTLESLMQHFNLPYEKLHRSTEDARATMKLYSKLIEIRDQKYLK